MARGRRKQHDPETEAKTIRRPGKDDIARAVAEVGRHKADAAEASGMAGQATKLFVDRWGLNRKAFGWATSLQKMEADKREVVIRDFLELIRKLGMVDQKGLFEDIGADVEETLAGMGAPTEEEIAERTAAEVAEAPDNVTKSFAERQEAARRQIGGPAFLDEVDQAVAGHG